MGKHSDPQEALAAERAKLMGLLFTDQEDPELPALQLSFIPGPRRFHKRTRSFSYWRGLHRYTVTIRQR